MSEPDQISADELDRKFDASEDISGHLDWSKARRPGREQVAKILRETRDRLLNEVQKLNQAIEQIEGGDSVTKR
jgi:hypothetical protein